MPHLDDDSLKKPAPTATVIAAAASNPTSIKTATTTATALKAASPPSPPLTLKERYDSSKQTVLSYVSLAKKTAWVTAGAMVIGIR